MAQNNQLVETMPPPRAFSDWLKELEKGKVHEHLGFLLANLTLDVLALKKAGSFTLKVTLKPSKIESNALEVYPVVTFKQPNPDPKPSIFFAETSNGALTRSDPNSTPLPLTVQVNREEIPVDEHNRTHENQRPLPHPTAPVTDQ